MNPTEIPAHTGSKLTRVLGCIAAGAVAVFLLMGLFVSPPDVSQKDSVRLFYLHVPSVIVAFYIAYGIVAVGSIMFLWKRSTFWDLMAASAAEIGTLFAAFTLITGSLWGRPTWGTYWTWDPRLTITAISFVLFLGYLAIRRLDMDPVARSQRAAILGLIGFLNTFLIRYSVQLWNGLHQGQTLQPLETQMSGTMLGAFFCGLAALASVFVWLLAHRFRVAWLEHEIAQGDIDMAIAQRQAEGAIHPRGA